jgi:hypothetical protein
MGPRRGASWPLTLVWLFIAWLYVEFTYWCLVPIIQMGVVSGVLVAWTFNLLAALTCVSLRVCTTTPLAVIPHRFRRGAAVQAPGGGGAVRHCVPCRLAKPPRCHHCSQCNACVLAMDHHCGFLGVCVGWHNRKSFVLFLVYSASACMLAALESFRILRIAELFAPFRHDVRWLSASYVLPDIAAALWHPDTQRTTVFLAAFSVGSALTLFGALHCGLVCFNVTMNELLNARRKSARSAASAAPPSAAAAVAASGGGVHPPWEEGMETAVAAAEEAGDGAATECACGCLGVWLLPAAFDRGALANFELVFGSVRTAAGVVNALVPAPPNEAEHGDGCCSEGGAGHKAV